jgi:hypothetical protein
MFLIFQTVLLFNIIANNKKEVNYEPLSYDDNGGIRAAHSTLCSNQLD